MAQIPDYDDETMTNLYIDNIKGISIQKDQPVDPSTRLWIEVVDTDVSTD